jgi:hypothetical protein
MGIFILLLIPGISHCDSDNNNSDDFSFTTVIAPGGFDRSLDLYLDVGDEIKVQVDVVSGGPVDIYIMTDNQFEAAYSYDDENWSTKAISYLKGKENINSAYISYKAPSYEEYDDEYFDYYLYFDTIYVVVDNRNSSLTPNDADSTGPVEVKVGIKIKRIESVPNFDPIIGACVIIGIILLIVLIIIVIYFVRDKKRKSIDSKEYEQQAKLQPQYQYPYYYPPWPPHGQPQPPSPYDKPSSEYKRRKTRKGRKI